jgi:hypothetical protein
MIVSTFDFGWLVGILEGVGLSREFINPFDKKSIAS